jgi:hypothetical protein
MSGKCICVLRDGPSGPETWLTVCQAEDYIEELQAALAERDSAVELAVLDWWLEGGWTKEDALADPCYHREVASYRARAARSLRLTPRRGASV